MTFSPNEGDLMIDSGEELNTPEAALISPKTSIGNQMIRDNAKSGSISTHPDILSQKDEGMENLAASPTVAFAQTPLQHKKLNSQQIHFIK